jgi:cell fate regulator YaaT (PSP1 superfamily)
MKAGGQIQAFDCEGTDLELGDWVVVKTDDSVRLGVVTSCPVALPEEVGGKPVCLPRNRKLLRVADLEDLSRQAENELEEREAREFCVTAARRLGLSMKIVCVERTFDRYKTVFYYTAEDRVDFRQLVKDLVRRLRTRVEMRQISVRSEALMLGGCGLCGRPLCCASFLKDFYPVSVRMAKEQNVAINTLKISGVCGRLMCCLAFEKSGCGRCCGDRKTVEEQGFPGGDVDPGVSGDGVPGVPGDLPGPAAGRDSAGSRSGKPRDAGGGRGCGKGKAGALGKAPDASGSPDSGELPDPYGFQDSGEITYSEAVGGRQELPEPEEGRDSGVSQVPEERRDISEGLDSCELPDPFGFQDSGEIMYSVTTGRLEFPDPEDGWDSWGIPGLRELPDPEEGRDFGGIQVPEGTTEQEGDRNSGGIPGLQEFPGPDEGQDSGGIQVPEGITDIPETQDQGESPDSGEMQDPAESQELGERRDSEASQGPAEGPGPGESREAREILGPPESTGPGESREAWEILDPPESPEPWGSRDAGEIQDPAESAGPGESPDPD